MASDSWYRIGTSDWPVTAAGETPVSHSQVLAVLDQVPTYYAGAMASLANTELPSARESRRQAG